MSCGRSGRVVLAIVGLAVLVGITLLLWGPGQGHHQSGERTALWVAWSGAIFAVLSAPSRGCCCGARLSRLFRRRTDRAENPYRDSGQS